MQSNHSTWPARLAAVAVALLIAQGCGGGSDSGNLSSNQQADLEDETVTANEEPKPGPGVLNWAYIALKNSAGEPVIEAWAWLSEPDAPEGEPAIVFTFDIPFTDCDETILTQEEMQDYADTGGLLGCTDGDGLTPVGLKSASCGVDGLVDIKVKKSDGAYLTIANVVCADLLQTDIENPKEFSIE